MASALQMNPEHSAFEGRRPSGQYSAASMMGPSSFQYAQQMAQYGQQRHDPTNYARTQQQQQHHFIPQQMVQQASQYQYANRPHPLQMQSQPSYPRMDSYAYGVSPSTYSSVDMRFPQQAFPMGYGPPGGFSDMSEFDFYSTRIIIINTDPSRSTGQTRFRDRPSSNPIVSSRPTPKAKTIRTCSMGR
jgi:hypothetical protein